MKAVRKTNLLCQICVLCHQTKIYKRALFARLPAGIKHLAETTVKRCKNFEDYPTEAQIKTQILHVL